MLTTLTIRNFAIIDDLALELEPGMTVLSGETGAGKSILIDALGLLLGDRADADAVRDGAERAEVSAAFSLEDAPAARAWLADRELEYEDECILRRVVSRQGRSRNWLNGAPANARDLRELGEHLVDIHGQHAHQSLLRPAIQRDLLDDYGQHNALRETLAALHINLRALAERIDAIEQMDSDGELRIDLLRYQLNELQALDLKPGEVADIEAEHKRLANAEQLIGDGQQTLALLYESESASAMDILGQSGRLLGELSRLDPAFQEATELAEAARIQTQEAADSLRRALDHLEVDPGRLSELDSRLGEIQDLARKHRCEPEELPAKTETLTAELSDLEGAEARLTELREQQDKTRHEYHDAAKKLHAKRIQTGKALAEQVTVIMRDLGMPQGEFEIATHFNADTTPSAHGLDRIEFLVAANPGQNARALERVASGGELSRISLALQVVAAASTRVPTLVFDEVDAGIGGGVAEIVGRQLRRLGEDRQALCVTHLPQVAAQAQHHLQVAKQVQDGKTRTRIQPLDSKQRIEELARMLGGVDITDKVRAHAREMIAQATA